MKQVTKGEAKNGREAAVAEPIMAEGAGKLFIPELKTGLLTLTIEGDSPLVVNRFDEKGRQQMLDKQMGKAVNKKEKKDPKACFLGAMHWIGEKPTLDERGRETYAKGRFGYPAVGIKKAMVAAARQLDGLKMTFLRGAFHVMGVEKTGLVEIRGEPRMREDVVRLQTGVADIRFRPEFYPWSMQFIIRYNTSVIQPGQLAHLLNTAGFAGGLGENRPERGGDWGLFSVAGSTVTTIESGRN